MKLLIQVTQDMMQMEMLESLMGAMGSSMHTRTNIYGLM